MCALVDMVYVLGIFATLLTLLAAVWRIVIWMPGRTPPANSPSPLDDRQQRTRVELEKDLQVLAVEIGERNVAHRYAQLVEAAEFLEHSLREYGYVARRQEFTVQSRSVWNVEAERPGHHRPDEVVIVGAHYDTVRSSPGANDNGSGVVATLALARAYAAATPGRTLRFVFFVNEEAPYYMTPAMGSLRCAERCRDNRERVVGMISLETIGCYLSDRDSQRYPWPVFRYLYPTVGNFVAVVGNVRSRGLVRSVVRGLRRGAFPSEGIAAPRWLKDIFRSDHAAFWQCGFPALMVTDTANFRYAYYHTAEDTVDKINFDMLARLVTALEQSLDELGGGSEFT